MKQTEIHRRKKENRAIFQLGLIVGSFMLGYFPNCGKFMVSLVRLKIKSSILLAFFACNQFAGPIFVFLRPGNTGFFEEMSQRWRGVSNTLSDLIDPRFKPQTSHSRFERSTNWPVTNSYGLLALFSLVVRRSIHVLKAWFLLKSQGHCAVYRLFFL